MLRLLILLIAFNLHAQSKSDLLTSFGYPQQIIENEKLREEFWVYPKKTFRFINGRIFKEKTIEPEIKIEQPVKSFKSGVEIFKALEEADKKDTTKSTTSLLPQQAEPQNRFQETEEESPTELVE